MAFSLPDLPYAHDALEPHIDTRTMQIHHGKHHQGYTNKLNAALEGHDDLQGKSIEDLLRGIDALPDAIKGGVRNNGGGFANHSLFWSVMSPNGGGAPSGDLGAAIDSAFGSFDAFKEKFSGAAGTRFWERMGLAGCERTGSTRSIQHSKPGQSLHERRYANPWTRRLGACLLSQLPESPARLRVCFLERG